MISTTTLDPRFRREGCSALQNNYGPGPELFSLQQISDFFQKLLLPRRRRGLGLFLFLAADMVDELDHQEDDERDDQEVDDVLHELAVGDLCVTDLPDQILVVDATDQNADQRHDQIGDERGDDLTERRADDDADGEVDDVALHRELAKLLQPAHG